MKKILKIIFINMLFLTSCKSDETQIEKEYYPINDQKNNIIINFKNKINSSENNLFKIYFHLSNFDNRNFDSTFYTFLEINEIGTLDIRINENNLIITDIYNQKFQTIINLEIMFPSYFNENTINDWIVSEVNEQAELFFNSTYEIASRSFFNTCQIVNNKTKNKIEVNIFVLNYTK